MQKTAILLFTLAALFTAAAEKRFETEFTKDLKVAAFYPPGDNKGYYLPGQDAKFLLALKNNTNKALSVQCLVQVKVYAGNVIYKASDLKLQLGASASDKLEFTVPAPKTRGYFVVEALLKADGRDAVATQSGFASVDPIAKRDPFFGFDQNGIYAEMLEGYKLMGAGSLGVGIHRPWIKTAEDVDKALQTGYWPKLLQSDDFKLVFHVAPTFRKTPETDERLKKGLPVLTDAELEHMRQYVERVAALTKGRVRLFLIQKEIDAQFRHSDDEGGGAAVLSNYVTLTRLIYRTIKKINPDANVAVLGIMGIDYYNTPQPFALSKIVLDDLKDDFDLLCIDAYNGNWNGVTGTLPPPEDGLRNFLVDTASLSAAYKRPGFVINAERGYCYDYFAPFDAPIAKQVADYTARSLIINKSAPSPYASWHLASSYGAIWRLTTKKADPSKPLMEMSIGWKTILDENGKYATVPKAPGVAYAVAARELAFAKPVAEILIGANLYCYTFTKPDGSSVAALWSIDEPAQIALRLPEASVVTDMMGNKTALAAGKNAITLTGSPIYLSSRTGAEKLAEAVRKAELPNLVPLVAQGYRNGAGSALVFLRNLENREQKGTLEMPDGNKISFTLPPLGTSTVTAKVSANLQGTRNAAVVTADGIRLEVPLDLDFLPVPRLAEKPVFNGSGDWFASLKGGSLVTPDNVFPKSAMIPEMNLFKLDGSDISAQYYLAYDSENLYLAVKVRDARHLQRSTGANIWKEDALQFVISTRDMAPKRIRPRTESSAFGKQEFNFGLALTEKGKEMFRWSGGKNPAGPVAFPSSVTRSEKDKTTLYEVAVPWAELGIQPKPGDGVRFSFVVMDNNREDDRLAKYWIALTEGVAGGNDSSLFKTLILK